ncbi:MFS general substrate transporter [Dichomitus squalens]|uniref:MFS general substrate transporter n=1 Tax=Dichomitus squalens TaxID=114155 RepID=A0A4Q9NPB6_9APHY|nr:MFS general substrate transporter [Dichomitus squalens]TBU55446.1 MFS general substrate transporter [Dichomitus squalens]
MSAQKVEKRTWTSYVWDTWDKPADERRFLFKLDACLLTYAALSYFSKYLDQQNITNAYVSGMQEDLGLHGNQLNYITTAWTCGYVIGQIPSNMLITRIRPSIWIPAMEVIWSVLTMTLASAKNFETLLAVRFLVGLAESTFYPAIQYVIGSWYKGDELGKRACIFHTASALGPMFSGFLQTAAYNGLNGVHGLAGWKWLFIIDGFITVPIGLLGFFIMPDLPTTTKPSVFYTAEQIEIGKRRMVEIGRKPPAAFTWKKVRGFFTTWHIYTLVPLYILFNNGGGPANSMIFWLKSFNTPGRIVYTVGQINTYPLGIQAVQVVTTLIYAWWSDIIRARWPPMLLAGTWSMVTCIVLAATPLYEHITRRWIFYYFTSVQGGLSGLILAWANELNGHDNEKRAFIVANCNMWAYVMQAWLPIVIFPQVEQPRVFKGNVATACINFCMMCFAMATLYLSKRDQRRERKLRASTVPSEVSEEYVLEDEADADIKKAKRHASEATTTEVTEIPVPTLSSEYRCATLA